MTETMKWAPSQFLRFEQSFKTSTRVCKVVTDSGHGFLKGLGNPAGPHALACDWVGTILAGWLGLLTAEAALIMVQPQDEIPMFGGGRVQSGPAMITREMKGAGWGGSAAELEELSNAADLSRLVVFDTWTRNCDRHPPTGAGRRPNPDNVFIATADQERKLIALDHSHCFCCGHDLTSKVANIDFIRDEQLYGLFPAFKPFLTRSAIEISAARLAEFTRSDAQAIVQRIPPAWDVDREGRGALVEFLTQRASFVAKQVLSWVDRECWTNSGE